MYFSVNLFHDNDVKFVELRTYLTSCLLKKNSSLQHELQFWDFFLDAQINTVKYLSFCDILSAFRDTRGPVNSVQVNQVNYMYIQFTGSTSPPLSPASVQLIN